MYKYILVFGVAFIVVLVLNQMAYGSCFEVYCLTAAIPKVLLFASLITGAAFALDDHQVIVPPENKKPRVSDELNTPSKNHTNNSNSNAKGDYWVGEMGMNLYLYDPEIQSGNPESVELYSYRENRVFHFEKLKVKQAITKVSSQDERFAVVRRKYYDLKKFYRRRLDDVGVKKNIPLTKTRSAGRVAEQTHCWRCKEKIIRTGSSKCDVCGWNICKKCSACNCDRPEQFF